MRHIVMTGRNGVGKSTLVRAILDEIALPVYGVITKKEAADCGGYQPVYIHLYGKECRFCEDNRIGLCRQGNSIAYPDAFDRFSKQMHFPNDGVIVFDELGFLESDAHTFTASVLHILDTAPMCVCAVRDKQTSFLDAVCSHPRAEVFSVTEENRTLLRAQILAQLPGLMKD